MTERHIQMAGFKETFRSCLHFCDKPSEWRGCCYCQRLPESEMCSVCRLRLQDELHSDKA